MRDSIDFEAAIRYLNPNARRGRGRGRSGAESQPKWALVREAAFLALASVSRLEKTWDGSDPKSEIASLNHTANVSGLIHGCIEADFLQGNTNTHLHH